MERILRIYQTKEGKRPFADWLENLKDRKARAIVRARLNRIQLGNFGDCKSVGESVFEFRIHYEPGYRIYFGREGEEIVVLLCGGDKSTQKKDILKAKTYWEKYKNDYK